MGVDGRQGVRRAGGVKLADRPVERADHEAIELQGPDQEPLHANTLVRQAAKAERTSSARAGDVAAPGKARTTTSIGVSTPESASATRWRRRRLTRLRVTALPTAFDTTKPAREGGQVRGTAWTTSVRRPTRTPSRETRRKSTEDFSRDPAGSTRVPERLSRRGGRGPCGDDRPRWRDQRGCACGGGSHGCGCGAGCSAGKCACSRELPTIFGSRTTAPTEDTGVAKTATCQRYAKPSRAGKPGGTRPSRA